MIIKRGERNVSDIILDITPRTGYHIQVKRVVVGSECNACTEFEGLDEDGSTWQKIKTIRVLASSTKQIDFDYPTLLDKVIDTTTYRDIKVGDGSTATYRIHVPNMLISDCRVEASIWYKEAIQGT